MLQRTNSVLCMDRNPRNVEIPVSFHILSHSLSLAFSLSLALSLSISLSRILLINRWDALRTIDEPLRTSKKITWNTSLVSVVAAHCTPHIDGASPLSFTYESQLCKLVLELVL